MRTILTQAQAANAVRAGRVTWDDLTRVDVWDLSEREREALGRNPPAMLYVVKPPPNQLTLL